MPTPPPPTTGPHGSCSSSSLPAHVAASLLASFTTFLTLAVHALLYHRGLYPPATFLTARALNLPVRQSRHPGLCAWINDAVAAVAGQLRRGAARRVAVVMHAPRTLAVLERWVFDVEAFPAWGDVGIGARDEDEEVADAEAPLDPEEDGESGGGGGGGGGEDDEVNWADVNEALRGALRRVAYAGESLPALPEGSTFTLAVELRDEAPAPIGHPQPWIPSQPKLQPPNEKSAGQGSNLDGKSTTPIRAVQAGPLFFECWVEQSFDPSSSS